MMNLIHWRLLVAVADAGSITRAAEQQGITQSGASQAIAQLEETLGVRLLVRESHRTVPTAVGEEIIARAREMLATLASIRSTAAQAKSLHGDTVRLATFTSVFFRLLSPLVDAFRSQHPGIDVVILEGTDEEVESWLASGDIDLGVVLNPAGRVRSVDLGRDEWVAVAPRNGVAGWSDRTHVIALEELVRAPFVLATGGCRVNARSLARGADLILEDVRMTVRDWSSALTLVQQGVGVSLVPESTLPVDRCGMRVYSLRPPVYRRFALAPSATVTESSAVGLLMDFIDGALAVERR
ncbi:LysR family transcriptional regulator [Arhodomonas sp. AD133]|uniref:LysR family transcriptional regulator n=1 Tax=Arhodomonas sp. AD133 TaxID=3415009 RepID=UPI003EB8E4ED